MLRLTLTSLWARKRRLLGTGLAVVVAVAFLSGTLILGDTLRSSFTADFTAAYEGIDVVVSADSTIGSEVAQQVQPIPASLGDQLAAIDGVEAIAGQIQGSATIVGADGSIIGGNGPPTLGVSWIENPDLNSWDVVAGRAPESTGEVVIDTGAAESGGLAVGDTTVVRAPEPVEVTIVGLIDSPAATGGVTVTAFTAQQARELFLGSRPQVTRFLVASDGTVSDAALAHAVAGVLPNGVTAITNAEAVEQAMADLGSDFLDFFNAMLLGFALVALVVAAFGINNTFAITIAQRTRESALLRAVGASRRQVLVSVVIEAVAIGTVASVLGLVAGLGLSIGLQAAMAAAAGLTASTPIVTGTTVAITLAVGLVVTLAAAIVPGVRASRVRPLEALRDAAVDESHASRARQVVGIVTVVAGVGLAVVSVLGTESGVVPTSIGAVLTLAGMVVLGPVAAGPVASALSRPLPRLRGTAGTLARHNALRSPRRTAGTASALMVGMAVVVLFTVVAASVSSTIATMVDRSFGGDLVVADTNFSGSGLSPELAAELEALPEIETAVGIGLGAARIDGQDAVFSVADPARLDAVLEIEMQEGTFAEVGPDEVAVATDTAEDHGWQLGDRVEMEFVDGATTTVTIAAIFASGGGNGLGTFIVPEALWARHTTNPSDTTVMMTLADGVPLEQGRTAVDEVTAAYGSPDVQDRAEYIESNAGQVDTALTIIYAMLALAILIALMGISNTLSLSIHERTRELGLLRAVGQTRSQARSMIRWESVVTALFGALGGIGLGLFLGWSVFTAVARDIGFGTFSVPFGQLGVILVLGGLVGVVAAIGPARRAARTDILVAIAAE